MTEYPPPYSTRLGELLAEDPPTPGRVRYGGRHPRLAGIKEDYVLHAASTFERNGFSVGIGLGSVEFEKKDSVGYFNVQKGRLKVPDWFGPTSEDAQIIDAAIVQWRSIGDGYPMLRVDVIRDGATSKPERVDIYWLKSWEEDK